MHGEDFSKQETTLGQGWDQSSEILDARSSSLFLKIEDGKSVSVSVVGEPEVYETEFSPGDGLRVRVKVDVFIPAENALKTWDMSKTTFEQLKRQRVRRGQSFVDAVIEVGRAGTEKKTKYWIEYVRQLEPAEAAQRDSHLKRDKAPIPF